LRGLYGTGGGTQARTNSGCGFVFLPLPRRDQTHQKNKKEQTWRGADGKQGEENANGLCAEAKYALHSDAYLPVPIFLGTGDPLTTISVQRMF
jgi:hypothetical protein